MKRIISKGTCELCGGTFGKAQMTKHLDSCQGANVPPSISGRSTKTGKGRVLRLRVEGRYLPEYWLYLEAPANTTLGVLDQVLRDIWLECCDHLSAFNIGEQHYYSHATGEEDGKSMKARLGDLLEPGMTFTYEYDFGSTTWLKFKVISIAEHEKARQSVVMLAQNEPPPITCGYCDKPATQVCGICMGELNAWVCDECEEKHKCEEPMFLKVVNSPRTGICGYEG